MIAPVSPVSLVVSEHLPIATPQTHDPDFGRRWAAWVTKGLAHDAQTRSRARIGLLVAGLVLAAVVVLRLVAA